MEVGVTEKATRAAAISLRRHWPLIAVFLWTAGVGALYVRCPGCLDRARDNRSCEWTGDTTARLDLRQPADWQHLVLDAQLAEGLAGRFADAASLKINGVEGHGGLIDDGALVRECRTRMFATIEANHRVGADQIEAARAQRRAPFDAAVLLLFLPLYWLGATLVDRRLRHRFASDPHLVRWVATAIASGTVAIVGAQLADLWSMQEASRMSTSRNDLAPLADDPVVLQEREERVVVLAAVAADAFEDDLARRAHDLEGSQWALVRRGDCRLAAGGRGRRDHARVLIAPGIRRDPVSAESGGRQSRIASPVNHQDHPVAVRPTAVDLGRPEHFSLDVPLVQLPRAFEDRPQVCRSRDLTGLGDRPREQGNRCCRGENR